MTKNNSLKSQLNNIPWAHVPSFMLILGYPIFWIELWWHKNNFGVTTPAAWLLWGALCGVIIWTKRRSWGGYQQLNVAWQALQGYQKWFCVAGLAMGALILGVCAKAALLPPHLVQEGDVLNYHYFLPRQHLIRNSFDYLSWTTMDLFPFPIQFGLAPFWFSTVLPNKIPQLIFLIGILLLYVRLLPLFGEKSLERTCLIMTAVLAAQFVGIQAGTAMLDIVISYLFLAAFDSLLQGSKVLAVIEGSFYLWSKSFIPFQFIIVMLTLSMMLFLLRRWKFQPFGGFNHQKFPEFGWAKIFSIWSLLIIITIIVAGPFLSKSWSLAGTPLYPFGVAWRHQGPPSTDFQNIKIDADSDLSMKDAFGISRTWAGFLKHFWLVAVPDQGVNNAFDYPVGLIYLICAGPFIVWFLKALVTRRIPVIPLLIIIFWMSWWFGSQQSRFLFIPLLLLFIVVLSHVRITPVLWIVILITVLINLCSVVRAHKPDWGKTAIEVLGAQDREMVELSQKFQRDGHVDRVFNIKSQMCYAQFPVRVLTDQR